MGDHVGLHAELAEMQREAVPVFSPFFAFAQVQLGHQLLYALQGNVIAMIVVALDDLLLVFGELGHQRFPMSTHDNTWCVPFLIGSRTPASSPNRRSIAIDSVSLADNEYDPARVPDPRWPDP